MSAMFDPKSNGADVDSGWVQVNNTVVPYVTRHLASSPPVRLIPLPVVQHGAGLLRDVHIQTVKATELELLTLNRKCRKAGLKFTFESNLELIQLSDVTRTYKNHVLVGFLSSDDPFSVAQFQPERCVGMPPFVSGRNQSPLSTTEPPPTNKQTSPDCSMTSQTVDGDKQMVLDLSKKSTTTKCSSTESLTMRSEGTKENPIDLTQKSACDELAIRQANSYIISASRISLVRLSQEEWKNLTGQVYIRPVRVHNRVIPAIVKMDIHFVLVETVRKAYFSSCSLTAFLFLIERYVGPYIYDLSPEDIQAIMHFTKNASCLKRCSKVISLRAADEILPSVKRFLDRVRSRARHKHEKVIKASQTSCSAVHDNS